MKLNSDIVENGCVLYVFIQLKLEHKMLPSYVFCLRFS